MQRPPRLALLAAAVYVVALLLIGLWPSHVDENLEVVTWPPVASAVEALGMTPATGYAIVESASNVLLFVPLGVLAMTLVPGLRWRWVVLAGFALSGAIEIAQAVLLAGRTSSIDDVVANTAGAAIGAALVVGWRRTRPRRAPTR